MTDRAALVKRLRALADYMNSPDFDVSGRDMKLVREAADALAAQESPRDDVARGQALIDGLADDEPPATRQVECESCHGRGEYDVSVPCSPSEETGGMSELHGHQKCPDCGGDGWVLEAAPETVTREQAETRLTDRVMLEIVNEWTRKLAKDRVLDALFPHDGSRP